MRNQIGTCTARRKRNMADNNNRYDKPGSMDISDFHIAGFFKSLQSLKACLPSDDMTIPAHKWRSCLLPLTSGNTIINLRLQYLIQESMRMTTIAIIEDDTYIGGLLDETLTQEGYSVIRAYSGTEALLLLEKKRPDLILLDLMLPGLTGEELLPRLKGIPVIVLSARAGIDDKVKLLTEGAADYMTKPFDIRELLARVAVQLRKASQADNDVLTASDLHLDIQARLLEVNNHTLHLTRTETAILKLLMQNPGQVIAKSVLLDRISLEVPDCTESSLKVHVSNLRKKLKTVSDREYIESVWGIGFRLLVE